MSFRKRIWVESGAKPYERVSNLYVYNPARQRVEANCSGLSAIASDSFSVYAEQQKDAVNILPLEKRGVSFVTTVEIRQLSTV